LLLKKYPPTSPSEKKSLKESFLGLLSVDSIGLAIE
jgi:hypothetical protein